eukprot:3026021-Pleurochrysis_carterae.AAC.6
MAHWERYVTTFRTIYGRPPVVYDLFCGEGTFSRGAVLAGAQVIGFDIQDRPRTFGMRTVSRLGGDKMNFGSTWNPKATLLTAPGRMSYTLVRPVRNTRDYGF